MQERVEFRNSRNQKLVGLLFPAASEKAVIMAHGMTGDKSSAGKCERIAVSLQQDMTNVLSFDFSGNGESDDEVVSLENEVDDLCQAISYMRERGARRVGLFGHSLGSLVCLRSSLKNIKALVLTGAITGPMFYEWLRYFTAEQLAEMDQQGWISEPRKSGRSQVVYSRQLFRDLEEIDQEKLLKSVPCPTLIIHGGSSEDDEEQQLLGNTREGMQYLSESSRLVVFENGKHSLMSCLEDVISHTRTWFNHYL